MLFRTHVNIQPTVIHKVKIQSNSNTQSKNKNKQEKKNFLVNKQTNNTRELKERKRIYLRVQTIANTQREQKQTLKKSNFPLF